MLCAENSHSKNYSFSQAALKYLSEPRTGTLDIRSLFYLIESFHVIAKKNDACLVLVHKSLFVNPFSK